MDDFQFHSQQIQVERFRNNGQAQVSERAELTATDNGRFRTHPFVCGSLINEHIHARASPLISKGVTPVNAANAVVC